jgi:hypothetical protein
MNANVSESFQALFSIWPAMLLVVAVVTAAAVGSGVAFVLLRKFRVAANTVLGILAFLVPASLAAWGMSFLVIGWSTGSESFDRMYAEPIAHKYAWPRDMNTDGLYTISDIWEVVYLSLFMPGDTLLVGMLIYAPGLGRFLEFSLRDLHGWSTGIVSAVVWVSAYLVLKTLIMLFAGKDELEARE